MAVGPSKPSTKFAGFNTVTPETSPFSKNMSRIGKFWISEKGRNAMGFIALAAASGYFISYVAIHAWFLPKYRDTVQLYKYIKKIKHSQYSKF